MLGQIAQDIADGTRTYRVDTLEWLIQEQDLGTMDEGSRQRYLFAHTHRIIDDQLLGIIGKRQDVQQFRRTPADIGTWYAIHMPSKD